MNMDIIPMINVVKINDKKLIWLLFNKYNILCYNVIC